MLASIQETRGNLSAAESTLRKGLDVFVNNTDILYDLGFMLDKKGLHNEAIAYMKQILAVDANHIEAMNFIGYSYAERSIKLDEAKRLIEGALRQNPRSGHILDSMGWLCFRQKRYKEARKYLEKAYSLLPNEDTIAEHLPPVYETMGQREDALKIYRALLQKQPTNKRWQDKIEPKMEQKGKKIAKKTEGQSV